MLIGEFQHNIDTKGRLIMPAKFRADLGAQFIVTKGLDGCLFGFPMESWAALQEKLKALSLVKKDARSFVRSFYSAATEVEIDKQGRINLPQNLIELAGIEKECRVIGVSDRIEIWSSERWEAYASAADENFEEIAEEMMEFGL
ncbi:division/cell wall cluster transcriptional repressor MraZ [Aerococcaceae bacterium NML191292]|nr:division/cell wall cluster transcriptional repressor MraZ [Aerococcaceae bacterium NML210727]MCW6654240.1 division/cell wall cluster transcriptional repressor MraZ [Aerococcaceae bacterium NML201296]MCW6660218.1 division/cell wall cluster transcriptional repressor MraZ [Aerococcaceae bacterium NML191292]MCW6661013.1 division/cell wall cluster transcriptional repressor MraZ [Aerococcaceae bacterium NML201209]MCW6663596.1 division/cell wall cluster transcriptional repressor MraZ [Aerococcaceae